MRIAGSVPALVVVPDGIDPLAEPWPQGGDERLAVERMSAEALPFLIRGRTGLVQDLLADLELPDVVQERGPVQSVEFGARKRELLSERVAVRADALRVPGRHVVVVAELGDEPKEDLGRLLDRRRLLGLPHEPHPLLERLDGPGTESELESRGCLVGEHERQVEQRSQRQQSARQGEGERNDEGRAQAEGEPPGEEQPDRP